LQRELPLWIAPQLEELTRNLTQQISDRGAAERTEQTQHLASAVESLRALGRQAEESASRLRAQAEQAEAQIANRAAESRRTVDEAARQSEVAANAHREALTSAANEIQQQVTAALSSAQTTWQGQLNSEVEAAQARWQGTLESTLAAAQEKAAASLDENVRSILSKVQEEAGRQTAAVHESITAAAAEAEQRAAGLRNSLQEQSQRLETALGRAAESSDRLEHFSARIETAQGQALAGFETQISDVFSLHRNELHRQSETLLEELNARIRSTFEENCRLALSKFDQQIDSMVQPHISRTEEAVHRLAGGRSLLDAALTLQQDRIRNSADEAFAESLARFRENLGGIDQLLQEAAQAVAERNLTEIESRVSDVKHQTVDDLMKSAEWYEKKAQTQIQSLTEKTVEQAEHQFREKAGEVSSVFASELDHSSRSFIGHTQTQMEEVVRDAFEHARALFAEAAETTTAAFTDEIQRQARQELDGFGQETQRSLNETRVQLDAARAELAQKVTVEQETFLRQFQTGMRGAVESGVADAHARVKAGLAPLLDSWRSTVNAHATEMRNIYAQMSNQAAEQHRSRLENVSNQWMLATVASLDHQSRAAVASIAANAQEKLRETCVQVFAGVGDALRERLQQIAANLTPPEPPMSRSQTAGSDR
ncbi:MAG: coiled-coil domain-containing protein, partial [Candidatus Acidiferrales bacterium]